MDEDEMTLPHRFDNASMSESSSDGRSQSEQAPLDEGLSSFVQA